MFLTKQLLAFRPNKLDWIFATKTFLAGMLSLYVAFSLDLASVHDKFHIALVLSGFFFLKISSTFLNSSFFPKPIKRRIAI